MAIHLHHAITPPQRPCSFSYSPRFTSHAARAGRCKMSILQEAYAPFVSSVVFAGASALPLAASPSMAMRFFLEATGPRPQRLGYVSRSITTLFTCCTQSAPVNFQASPEPPVRRCVTTSCINLQSKDLTAYPRRQRWFKDKTTQPLFSALRSLSAETEMAGIVARQIGSLICNTSTGSAQCGVPLQHSRGRKWQLWRLSSERCQSQRPLPWL